jgi:hypothetical protein
LAFAGIFFFEAWLVLRPLDLLDASVSPKEQQRQFQGTLLLCLMLFIYLSAPIIARARLQCQYWILARSAPHRGEASAPIGYAEATFAVIAMVIFRAGFELIEQHVITLCDDHGMLCEDWLIPPARSFEVCIVAYLFFALIHMVINLFGVLLSVDFVGGVGAE